jgi:dihydrodipicolinate synthase/N-acetylneuraminate lyase
MRGGAGGGIVAVSIFGGALAVAIHDAVVRGDDAAATALQARMKPMGGAFVGELGVAGVKAAAELVGLAGGVVRGPLTDLDAAGRARVRELLVAGGIPVVG